MIHILSSYTFVFSSYLPFLLNLQYPFQHLYRVLDTQKKRQKNEQRIYLHLMENMLKTPPKVPIQTPTPTTTTTEPECKTPTLPVQQLHNSDDHKSPNELRKPVTPDRLRVPKAFKYPERYTSPTDMLISPVTKGLLARNKRGGALLPPGKFQPKVPDLCLQDVSPLENKLPLLIDEKNNST